MRRRALLALAAGLLLSGCIALAPRETLDQDRAVEVAPGETFTRTIPLPRDARSEIAYRVHNEVPGTRLVACEGLVGAFFPPGNWSPDSFDVFFAGCKEAGAADVEGTDLVEPGTMADHALAMHCDEAGPACKAIVTLTTRSVNPADGKLILLVALVALAILFRIAADRLDRARIREFVRTRGGRVEDISWQPFGRGWFGERGERVYEVKFVDANGQARKASFKTSLFSGVWTDDLR